MAEPTLTAAEVAERHRIAMQMLAAIFEDIEPKPELFISIQEIHERAERAEAERDALRAALEQARTGIEAARYLANGVRDNWPDPEGQAAARAVHEAINALDAARPSQEVAALRAALDVRPEVLAFARLMERELRANDHKPGWKADDPTALARRVQEEASELVDVVGYRSGGADVPRDLIAEEAADVANMAMMVADVCGCLKADAARPSRGEAP